MIKGWKLNPHWVSIMEERKREKAIVRALKTSAETAANDRIESEFGKHRRERPVFKGRED